MVSGQSASIKYGKDYKTVKFNPENFSYYALHITFTVRLPVETNAIKLLGLQLDSHL
jgi:hypothetical protein